MLANSWLAYTKHYYSMLSVHNILFIIGSIETFPKIKTRKYEFTIILGKTSQVIQLYCSWLDPWLGQQRGWLRSEGKGWGRSAASREPRATKFSDSRSISQEQKGEVSCWDLTVGTCHSCHILLKMLMSAKLSLNSFTIMLSPMFPNMASVRIILFI